MIKPDSLAKLLVKIKIAADEAAAKEIISAKDERDVAIPDTVQLFTAQELETRESTQKAAQIKAGMEIAIKQLKESTELKYDGEGSKDPAKFIEAFRAKVLADANVSVDEKVKEKESVISKLRDNIRDMEAQKAASERQMKETQLEGDILMWTADKKPDNLTNKEWVTLLKMNNELVEDAGQLFVKRNGEVIKDPKLLTPIPAKDAIVSYIEERKLGKVADSGKQAGGGRGGNDSKAPVLGIQNMSQFNKHLEDNKIDPKGSQAKALLNTVMTENTAFNANE